MSLFSIVALLVNSRIPGWQYGAHGSQISVSRADAHAASCSLTGWFNWRNQLRLKKQEKKTLARRRKKTTVEEPEEKGKRAGEALEWNINKKGKKNNKKIAHFSLSKRHEGRAVSCNSLFASRVSTGENIFNRSFPPHALPSAASNSSSGFVVVTKTTVRETNIKNKKLSPRALRVKV